MDTKALLIAAVMAAAWAFASCAPTPSASAGQARQQAPAPKMDARACYAKAHDIVAPDWDSLNTAQRGQLALQAIWVCEGGLN